MPQRRGHGRRIGNSVGERSRPDDIEAGKARNSLYRADSGLRVVLQRDERYTGCRGQVARQQSSHRSAVSGPPPLPSCASISLSGSRK